MKKILLILAFALSLGANAQQQTKVQAKFSIDSLIPTNNTKAITAARIQQAFQKAINYAEPNTTDLLKAGANPNGTTNTTSTIVATFAAGKKVYVPAGTYLVNSEIVITNNIECEKGAVFKVANGYVGNVFAVRSQKNISIKGLYVDATGTGIRCQGLKIEGLWNSTIDSPSFVFNPSDTSSVGIDIYSSNASALNFGVYGLTIQNPYLVRGKHGIRTTKTASDGVAITHLNVYGGWVTSQTNAGVLMNDSYNFEIRNTAFDFITTGATGLKLVNSHQGKILFGEYNSGTLMNVSSNSDYIDVDAPRGLNPATAFVGTNYSYRTANAIRLNPTSVTGFQTGIEGRYDANTPFRIYGNYFGSDVDILSFHTANGLTPRTQNPDNAVGSYLLAVNAGGGIVKFPNNKYTEGTAAPSSGTWTPGDYCRNLAPAPGGYMGWVYTTSGTWKGYGLIQN